MSLESAITYLGTIAIGVGGFVASVAKWRSTAISKPIQAKFDEHRRDIERNSHDIEKLKTHTGETNAMMAAIAKLEVDINWIKQEFPKQGDINAMKMDAIQLKLMAKLEAFFEQIDLKIDRKWNE